jgi:hypothetical protein
MRDYWYIYVVSSVYLFAQVYLYNIANMAAQL